MSLHQEMGCKVTEGSWGSLVLREKPSLTSFSGTTSIFLTPLSTCCMPGTAPGTGDIRVGAPSHFPLGTQITPLLCEYIFSSIYPPDYLTEHKHQGEAGEAHGTVCRCTGDQEKQSKMAFRRREPLSPEPPRPLCLLSSLREASGRSNGLSFMPCSNIP